VTVGGNIGAPPARRSTNRPRDAHVVEASSFQLENPDVSSVDRRGSNLADHRRHPDVCHAGEGAVFANQTDADWAVVNADDLRCSRWHERARQTSTLQPQRRARGRRSRRAGVNRRHEGPICCPTIGHPLARRTCGRRVGWATVGVLAGASATAMTTVVDGFAPRARDGARDEIGGVRSNDSKATNVDAARRAIETFT
jgi:UDP-N-acetylmuramoylalanine-D-glutamate ligase